MMVDHWVVTMDFWTDLLLAVRMAVWMAPQMAYLLVDPMAALLAVRMGWMLVELMEETKVV